MASTKEKVLQEVLQEVAGLQRIEIERAEVILSHKKCAEYAFHPETKYLLCFESSLTPQQISALRSMFSGMNAKNVFVIGGTEEPKVYRLDETPVRFSEQRMF